MFRLDFAVDYVSAQRQSSPVTMLDGCSAREDSRSVSGYIWYRSPFLSCLPSELRATRTRLSAGALGLFAVLLFVFDDLVLLLLLHVTVQVADEELRVCLDVIDGQVKDILPVLSEQRKFAFQTRFLLVVNCNEFQR